MVERMTDLFNKFHLSVWEIKGKLDPRHTRLNILICALLLLQRWLRQISSAFLLFLYNLPTRYRLLLYRI